MGQMIPAEAVEAAAKVHQDLQARRGHPSWDELGAVCVTAQQLRLDYMATALESAAPYLMAQAWDEGASWMNDSGAYWRDDNPYRSKP